MKTGFLITARLKSTRLPKKVILPIHGREIIRWMIDRLKLSGSIDQIVVCTSTNRQDDLLEQIADEEQVGCFRGSEEDVIKRLYNASRYFGLDYALNITADSPLVSTEYFEEIIKTYIQTNADLVRVLDLPHGCYSYGLKIEAMRKVCEIKKTEETEIWGLYFTDTGLFDVVDIEVCDEYKRDYRLTLDYPADFEFFQEIFNYFGEDTYKISTQEIIRYLDVNPSTVAINKHCEEMFKKRFAEQSMLKV